MLAVVVATAGCGAAAKPQWSGSLAAPEKGPESVVFLIGDAGKATTSDPVIRHLKSEVRRAALAADSQSIAVVFLGDNIYDNGLPPPGHANRATAQAILDAQIDVVQGTRVRAFFVPGNHDWDHSGKNGLDHIKEQHAYLRAASANQRVSMLPHGVDAANPAGTPGCPGPDALNVGSRVLLVGLDTEWWLHPGKYGRPPGCPLDQEKQVLDKLAELVDESDDREVIVVTHHPLTTAGPHGGFFPVNNHLFPPVIGSLIVLGRVTGASNEDLSGPRNRSMRVGIRQALAMDPPALFAAAGHDHSLQVICGNRGVTVSETCQLSAAGAEFVLVSGSGSKVTGVAKRDETLFAAAERGYMRLEFRTGGHVRLAVIGFGRGGDSGPHTWCQEWRITYPSGPDVRVVEGVRPTSSCTSP